MLKRAKRAVRESIPVVELLRHQGIRQGSLAYRDFRSGSAGVRFDRDGPLQIARESTLASTFSRMAASKELENLVAVLDADDRVVLDAGAHSGLFSTLVKRRFPNARIVAVEANPTLHPVIEANLTPFKDWTLIPKALSDHTGTATFHRSAQATQTSALDPESAALFGGPDGDSITVDTTTIDTIADELKIDSFDVIKIDIQGAESMALRGAAELLPRTKKLIIEVTFMEDRPEDLLTMLRDEFGAPTLLQPVVSGADLLYKR